MTGRNRYSAVMLLGLVAGVIGCGGGGVAGDGGDAVAVGVGLSDAEAGEIVADAEVDGTDSLPDVIADVVDVADTSDTGPNLCAPGAQDVHYAPDWGKPWITEDIDISHLGFVAPASCPGCGLYREVSATDAPTLPECATPCPAGYPCTCGVCPWVPTLKMTRARFYPTVLWTGEEVVIIGGQDFLPWGTSPPPAVLTMERWNPNKGDGFQPIDLPFDATWNSVVVPRLDALWTGKEVFAATYDKVFRFDPTASKVTLLPTGPVFGSPRQGGYTGDAPRLFWGAGKLFVWGTDPLTSALNPTGLMAKWTDAGGWQPVAMPYAPPIENLWATPCATALGGAIYAFFPIAAPGLFPPSVGLDPKKPVMVRFDMATEVWEVLPQNSLPGITCNALERNVFSAFGEGIIMLPQGKTAGQHGQVWWQAKGQWMPTPPLPFRLVADGNVAQPIWTNKLLVIPEVEYQDPMIGTADGGGVHWFGPTWPMTYDPYANRFGYVTSVGFPKHERAAMGWAASGTELFAFGGSNGTVGPTLHDQGYKLPLPQP